jgi:mRNA-degrading endonuclease RelE of RelBE toxin-antitoxin system
MAGFEVILTKKAVKELRQLPKKIQVRVKRKLLLLEKDPHAQKKLGGELAGMFTIRIWPYRAIFWIEKKIVWVIKIQHRQGVYK